MKARKFIKQIFLKHEISSRITPLISRCSYASILHTALDKVFYHAIPTYNNGIPIALITGLEHTTHTCSPISSSQMVE